MIRLNNFWRPVILLITGNGLGQVLNIIALPILTRIYAPESFGVFSIYVAIVVTVAVVVNGGYEWAVMLPQKIGEALGLVNIGLIYAVGISTIVAICVFIFSNSITTFLHVEQLQTLMWVIPISLLIEGIIQPIRVMINRIKMYRTLAVSRIGKSSAQVLGSLWAGFAGWGFEGLIWGFLAGQIMCLLLLLLPFIKWQVSLPNKKFSLATFNSLRKSYDDFPKYSVFSTLLTTASKQLPFFLIPLLYIDAMDVNGLFSKADQILLAPLGLISASVGNVFFERASHAKRLGGEVLSKETWNTFKRLTILGLPFLIAILFAGPWLFSFVLGPEWETAGVYARWLSPSMYLLFISSPLSCLVDIQRALQPFLLITIGVFSARFGLLWIGGMNFPPFGMIQLYAMGSITIVGAQLIYLLQLGTNLLNLKSPF